MKWYWMRNKYVLTDARFQENHYQEYKDKEFGTERVSKLELVCIKKGGYDVIKTLDL